MAATRALDKYKNKPSVPTLETDDVGLKNWITSKIGQDNKKVLATI